MDVRKRKQLETGKSKSKNQTQIWRAVSTVSSFHEGDSEKGRQEKKLEEARQAATSTVPTPVCGNADGKLQNQMESTQICENTDAAILNSQTDPNTHPREGRSNDDISSSGKSKPSEKHSLSVEIGSSLMRFIKGKGGSKQEEIEQETQVKIIFPSSRNEDSIIIEGNSPECVTEAYEKIQSIIDEAVNSRSFDYSHFVSLPLASHPGLVNKLVDFQNKILATETSEKDRNVDGDISGDTSDEEKYDKQSNQDFKVLVEKRAGEVESQTKEPPAAVEINVEDVDAPVKVNLTNIPLVSYRPKESKVPASESGSSKLKDSGIEKSIFIKPQTFHLTVLMLKLWNKDRVKTASEVLQSVSSKVMDALENRPVSIRLNGLECMKGSLAKARVLYAPVEEIGDEGRLRRACQVIIDAFVEAGLVLENDAKHQLKLHATVINARHRKRWKGGKKLEWFNGRGIFELYGSEEWGEYPIEEAHLSQRFKFDENGYYHCCASIPFLNDKKVLNN